jgi:hypothetical protein
VKNNLKSVLGYSFAIAFAWAASFGNANAILVKGHIDPLFGGSGVASGVYWTALLEFTDSDNSCIAADGVQTCTPDAGSLSVTGTLQEGANTAVVDFLFGGSTPTITVDVQGGVIQAIQTGPIGPTDLITLGSLQAFGWIDFEFGSFFDSDNDSMARLLLQLCPPPSDFASFSTFSSSHSYYCQPAADCTPNFQLVTEFSDPALVTVEQIPEPATALLLLGALASGWIVRRRSA